MRIRLYRSGQALYGVAKALYWISSKRQISTHLTVLKYQNTKTSLYKLSENHRVFALFEFFGFVRKRMQFTVFNDHPVLVKRITKSEGYPAIATRKPAATIGQVMSKKIKRFMYT